MQTVMHTFESIAPLLDLAMDQPFKTYSPAQVKCYLEINSPRFCVLVVNAETVQDDPQSSPRLKDEYKELFKTVLNKVGKLSGHSILVAKHSRLVSRQVCRWCRH